MEDTGEDFWFSHNDLLVQWFQGAVLFGVVGVLSYVETLQGLGLLSMSVVTVDARAQWFNGSMVQMRVW